MERNTTHVLHAPAATAFDPFDERVRDELVCLHMPPQRRGESQLTSHEVDRRHIDPLHAGARENRAIGVGSQTVDVVGRQTGVRHRSTDGLY
jgi:hypothetical protein